MQEANAGSDRPGSEETTGSAGQLRLDVGDGGRVGYRGPTVCKIVGITYRQLDYWARTDLVTPSVRPASGSGTQRLYSFDDVVALRVVKRLLDAGVSLQRVRVAVDELRGRGHTLSDVTLVADDASVYMVDDQSQVIDLLQRGQGVFAIALGPVVDQLRGEVTAFPSEALDEPSDRDRAGGDMDTPDAGSASSA